MRTFSLPPVAVALVQGLLMVVLLFAVGSGWSMGLAIPLALAVAGLSWLVRRPAEVPDEIKGPDIGRLARDLAHTTSHNALTGSPR